MLSGPLRFFLLLLKRCSETWFKGWIASAIHMVDLLVLLGTLLY